MLRFIAVCAGILAIGWLVFRALGLPLHGLFGGALAWVICCPSDRISICIDAHRVEWREMAFVYRLRAPRDRVRARVERVGAEHALLLDDGKSQHLVAKGAPADVDALAQHVERALLRFAH